jgi:glycosyltransferase involved in cell wall biosynthesis
VLHVLATTQRRGAEVFASELIGALDAAGLSQRVAVIRRTPLEVYFPVPWTTLDAAGTRMPGIRLDARTVRQLRRLATRWRPHVVQAHGGEALKYAVLALAGTRIPIVYRRIGMAPQWLRRGPRKAVHGWLMRRSARVVAVAEEVQRETVELFGVPSPRAITIPNGVDQ